MTTRPPDDLRRPTVAQLAEQLGAVLADLPLFLTAPLYRRRHLSWGAMPEEVAAEMERLRGADGG